MAEVSDTIQQYCLRWNNHRVNLLIVFEHLFQAEAFTDVTLACEGYSIKCHKIVLAACSTYFQNLFLENECRHPIVILKDIKYSEIRAILEYMYRGEVNVAQDELAGLLKAAETLRVKGLVEDNQHLSEPHRSPHQSPSHAPSIPIPTASSEIPTASTSSAAYAKTTSFAANKFSAVSGEPVYETPQYNCTVTTAERANPMQVPLWPPRKATPSPSPKHTVSYENVQSEHVPLKKKRYLGATKDTPILRTVLGHSSLHHNGDVLPPSQTPPLQLKSLNYSMVGNVTNGPMDHNEKVCVYSY